MMVSSFGCTEAMGEWIRESLLPKIFSCPVWRGAASLVDWCSNKRSRRQDGWGMVACPGNHRKSGLQYSNQHANWESMQRWILKVLDETRRWTAKVLPFTDSSNHRHFSFECTIMSLTRRGVYWYQMLILHYDHIIGYQMSSRYWWYIYTENSIIIDYSDANYY